MQLYFSEEDLGRYIARQLDSFFPCNDFNRVHNAIAEHLTMALARTEYCFARIKVKYFSQNGEVFFSPLITDQYAVFLYYLAHTVYTEGDNTDLAGRLYYLNKALNGVDLYFEVQMPRVFLLVHPVGTVLGRARYGDYLVVYQGVTVGANLKDNYPEIGQGVALFSNSSVLGDSKLNDGAVVAARAVLQDTEVPANHVCFGTYPDSTCKPTRHSVFDKYFLEFPDENKDHR